MSKPSQKATDEVKIKMKYTGPKERKVLDLPLGVNLRAEWTHQVIFSRNNNMIGGVPAQFVETLLTLPEHYQYADDAARTAYASWLVNSLPSTDPISAQQPPAAPSLPNKPVTGSSDVPVPRTVKPEDTQPVRHLTPTLEHFEELV